MAQSDYTRRKLAVALGSQSAASALVTIIDAGTGTVAQDTKRRLWQQLGVTEANVFAAAAAADTSLTDPVEGKLTQVIGETATKEITAEQGS